MTTATLTLSAFLLSRLAEDEAVARDVIADTDVWSMITEEYVAPNIKYAATYMRRLTPERLLAECEAKRRIVELHAPRLSTSKSDWYGEDDPTADMLGCDECGSFGEYTVAWPCRTLKALANVYGDHPDFDPDWA